MVIALVTTPTGLPITHEVMDGNTPDKTTLRGFLDKVEAMYGKARRVWLMDRGIPTEALLKEMRESRQETFYLVGTSRSKIKQYEQKWLDLPWPKAKGGKLTRLPSAARRLCGCCASCERCDAAVPSATSC